MSEMCDPHHQAEVAVDTSFDLYYDASQPFLASEIEMWPTGNPWAGFDIPSAAWKTGGSSQMGPDAPPFCRSGDIVGSSHLSGANELGPLESTMTEGNRPRRYGSLYSIPSASTFSSDTSFTTPCSLSARHSMHTPEQPQQPCQQYHEGQTSQHQGHYLDKGDADEGMHYTLEPSPPGTHSSVQSSSQNHDDDDDEDEQLPITARSKRRARKRSSVSLESHEHKRTQGLERNRAAANKCRKKKKGQIRELEETKDELEAKNADLLSQHEQLVSEVARIKNSLLSHAGCNDQNIDGWIEAEARNYVKGNNDSGSRHSSVGKLA